MQSLSGTACLLVPSRVDLNVLTQLSQQLGDQSPISWLVDENHLPDKDILNYLGNQRAAGIRFSSTLDKIDKVTGQIRAHMQQGYKLVLLYSPRPHTPQAIDSVPQDLLRYICSIPLPLTPLYVGMSKRGDYLCRIECPESYDRLALRSMPPIPQQPKRMGEIRLSWMEASSTELDLLPELVKGNLAMEILQALIRHPQASVIDGVDDSILSYDQLLNIVVPLARLLRKRYSQSMRMGIILPPCRSAVIANVACILAGISPVNINYDLDSNMVKDIMEKSNVSHYITENHCFKRLQHFNWPPSRDLIMLNELIPELGSLRMRVWGALARNMPSNVLFPKLGASLKSIDDETLLLFSGGTTGHPKAYPVSHRMVLSSQIQLMSCINLDNNESALSSLPYYHNMGLNMGLIFPLLQGLDIITYTIPQASKRIFQLVKNYQVGLMMTTPDLLRIALKNKPVIQPKHCPKYLLSTGDMLSNELRMSLQEELGLKANDCYALSESIAPISLEQEGIQLPLPGTALRVANPSQPQQIFTCEQMGMLWLKGASLPSRDWVCSEDMTSLSMDSQLKPEGRKERFTALSEGIVSHEALEQLLYRIFKRQPDTKPLIAVVGICYPEHTPERLILITTIHPNFPAHGLTSLRYDIMNERSPSHWCPSAVIPVDRIPLRPNGKLDYQRCRKVALHILQQQSQRLGSRS